MSDEYEVIVGNIGSVHIGDNPVQACKVYGTYKHQSKAGHGKAGGEDVTVLKNGDLLFEFQGRSGRREELEAAEQARPRIDRTVEFKRPDGKVVSAFVSGTLVAEYNDEVFWYVDRRKHFVRYKTRIWKYVDSHTASERFGRSVRHSAETNGLFERD